jgi:predicted nuclease of predicted toxin-antitoxin system
MGISMTVVRNLRESGHDVIHLREEGLQRLPDLDIVKKAKQEERVILTFDLDFGNLLAASGEMLHSEIIFRLLTTLPDFVSERLLSVLAECGESLESGVIIVVEDNRYRVRRLPI